MDNKSRFSRVLAIGGTILVWLPVAAMLVFSVAHLIRSGQFMADYLLPAELFLVVVAGAGLLLWAAIRSKSVIKELIIAIVLGLTGLLLSQGVAVWTGLAHGDTEPTGWPWITVLGLIILYDLAVVFLGIIGIRLISKLSLNITTQ
jgi:hypothetical protein